MMILINNDYVIYFLDRHTSINQMARVLAEFID